MATPLLYRPAQRSRVWLALGASAFLHGAAIVLAQFDRAEPTQENGSDGPPPVEIEFPPTDDAPLPPDIPESTPPPIAPDEPLFSDKVPAPPPVRRQDRKSQPPIVRSPTGRSGPAGLASVKVMALNAPRPEYPYEARRGRITGSGVAALQIDPANGAVIAVAMTRSTGNAVLDEATITGFRRWRFKPGTPPSVTCPITFTLTGAAY